MSYPEARYLADTGEVSASFRPAATPADLIGAGATTHYLASSAMTGGDYGLFRWDMSERPSGPDPHFHKTISEAFFVLFGVVRLYDGDRWVEATAGDFLYVPPGGIHAFRNESGSPASMLLLFAPGAPREKYFEALAERAATGQQLTEEERIAFLRRHDQYMV